MKLSNKLQQLQNEARRGELTDDGIEDGFNRCIEDAEYFEAWESDSIKLSDSEIQSKFHRVKYAEGLIMQLPKEHEGRNTWLLNYGKGTEAQAFRSEKGLSFIKETQSCETVK